MALSRVSVGLVLDELKEKARERAPALDLHSLFDFSDRISTYAIHESVFQIFVAELLAPQAHSVDIAS
jgi:hypothetical protein